MLTKSYVVKKKIFCWCLVHVSDSFSYKPIDNGNEKELNRQVEKEEMKRCESFGEEISGKMIDLVKNINNFLHCIIVPSSSFYVYFHELDIYN